ncbi:MAG: hypothetical protein AABX19_03470 [Nanoarchaeota archaeon]
MLKEQVFLKGYFIREGDLFLTRYGDFWAPIGVYYLDQYGMINQKIVGTNIISPRELLKHTTEKLTGVGANFFKIGGMELTLEYDEEISGKMHHTLVYFGILRDQPTQIANVQELFTEERLMGATKLESRVRDEYKIAFKVYQSLSQLNAILRNSN